MESEIQLIKTTILEILSREGTEPYKIILFGSKARGDFTRYSDYDLLLVLAKYISIHDKIKLSTKIQKRLAELFIDADILIKSTEELERYKDEIGSVTMEALREGILI